jgi:hypothetical protein
MLDQRCRVRFNPVKTAVLAAVLHHSGPCLAALDGAPEIGEGLGRHVGMAHDVLRRSNQFLFAETADMDEIRIDIGNIPLQVSLGNDGLSILEDVFDLCDWSVIAHWLLPDVVDSHLAVLFSFP